MPPKTVVKPIQEDSVAQPMPAGGAAPINDSEVVDEGPANANIPSSQHAQFDRSGTQDALRGQGNSAAPSSSLSRENQAPVAREQKKAAEFGDQFGVSVEGKGDGEGFKTTSAKEGEPRAGKVHADNPNANLVEAGTTMAGDAGADSGIDGSEEEGTEGGMRAAMEPKPKL
ncbi:hypothetical protein JCM9279_003842 [Rhodotorula babjevae]